MGKYTDLEMNKSLLLNFIRSNSKQGEIELKELEKNFEISIFEISKALEEIKADGYPLTISQRGGELYLNYIRDINIKQNEIHIKTPIDEPFKVLVISDLRTGSIYEQPTIYQNAIQNAYNSGCRTIIISGDLTEGLYPSNGKTKRSKYYNTLFLKDTYSQIERFIKMYPHLEGMKTYFITGDKDATHNNAFERPIGKRLEGIRDDMHFLGELNGILKVNDTKILVRHHGTRKTYTVSYLLEQYLKSKRSEDKPDIVLNGGLLQMEHLPNYREMEAFSIPSMVATTSEMDDRSWPNTIGAWEMELSFKKDGTLDNIKSIRVPYFVTNKDDYLTAKPIKGVRDVINANAEPKIKKPDIAKKIDAYYRMIKNDTSLEEVASTLGLNPDEVDGLFDLFKLYGKKINTYKIQRSEENQNAKPQEVIMVDKRGKIPKKHTKPSKEDLIKSSMLIIGDLHLGAKRQQPTMVKNAHNWAIDRGITTGLINGDLTQGDYIRIRPEEQYALKSRGFDEQYDDVMRTIEQVPGFNWLLDTGSHDETHIKNGGASLGYHLSQARKDMFYIGQDIATFAINGNKFFLNPNVPELNPREREVLRNAIREGRCGDYNLMTKDRKSAVVITANHPGGGSAASRSYNLQKQLENLESNYKPKVFIDNHYHKTYDFLYRNIFGSLVGCLTDKSSFSQKLNLANIMSATIMETYSNEKGEIEYISFDYKNFGRKDVILDDWSQDIEITQGIPKILSRRNNK